MKIRSNKNSINFINEIELLLLKQSHIEFFFVQPT